MKFSIKKFNELTVNEMYVILQLRSEVFVVEQDCVFQDLDNKDQIAYHVLGLKDDKIIAYARIFDSEDYFLEPSIGRITVKKEFRKFNAKFPSNTTNLAHNFLNVNTYRMLRGDNSSTIYRMAK